MLIGLLVPDCGAQQTSPLSQTCMANSLRCFLTKKIDQTPKHIAQDPCFDVRTCQLARAGVGGAKSRTYQGERDFILAPLQFFVGKP